ncbi:hypothetical protein [Ramlibacter rhizophilus]|uniref:Uncharacterized protein n=1 Tax=Ramlibacter rhizophilus TaxID=1781167 RepID=A0A4Z0BZU8_9BURK|nr:hypothetical protein [Ramlibacter rhizophilus]TFZ04887.1 hypothetical protein EZ242_03835 [Ramlibacter rhizophilus]
MQPTSHHSPRPSFDASPRPDRKAVVDKASSHTVGQLADALRAQGVPQDWELRLRRDDVLVARAPAHADLLGGDAPLKLAERFVRVIQLVAERAPKDLSAGAELDLVLGDPGAARRPLRMADLDAVAALAPDGPEMGYDGKHAPREHPLARRLAAMAAVLKDKPAHPLSLDKVGRKGSDDVTGFLTPWYGAAATLGRACADDSAGQPPLTPEAMREAFPLNQRSSLLAALHVSLVEAPQWMAHPDETRVKAAQAQVAADPMFLATQRWMFHLARAFGPEEFMPPPQQERARAIAGVVAAWARPSDWRTLSDERRGAQLRDLALDLAECDKLDVGRMRWELVNRPGGPLVSQPGSDSAIQLNTGWAHLDDEAACVAELLLAHQGQYQLNLMKDLMSGVLGPKEAEYEMARVFVATGALGSLRPDEVADLNGITFGEAQEWLQAFPSVVHALASTRAVLSAVSERERAPDAEPDADPQPASASSSSVSI